MYNKNDHEQFFVDSSVILNFVYCVKRPQTKLGIDNNIRGSDVHQGYNLFTPDT